MFEEQADPDVARLLRRVVKGPNTHDCWIWVGAIGDDGYGRFWTQDVEGNQRVVRPQRFLYEKVTGHTLATDTLLLHNCDIPLCVHIDVHPHLSHLRPGTGTDNQRDAARSGRSRNIHNTTRYATLPRAEFVARSRRLRDTVRTHGYDTELIHTALNPAAGTTGHDTLF